MTSQTWNDYWNASSNSGFNFDYNEESVPLSDLERKTIVEESFNTLPLHSIISQNSLDLILDDITSTLEYVIPSVEETIEKAFIGYKYSFEIYRRFNDKIQLLESALLTSDGGIILNVILFLKSTLRSNIFFQQLAKQKAALKHYSFYLIVNSQFEELIDLCMATGNSASLHQFFYFVGRDINTRIGLYNRLKQFSSENLQSMNSPEEKLEIQENLSFLEWQVEKNQSVESVIEQLAVICYSEWQKDCNSNDRIMEFKKLLKIDEMAFEWTAMNVLCYMKLWPQLLTLFLKPNWFNKKNVLKTIISQEIFVYGVSKHKPPKDILEQLLSLIPDLEKSVNLAQKLQCHKIVIQHYISNRDRLALISYKTKVSPQEEDYFSIENALQSADKKWKN